MFAKSEKLYRDARHLMPGGVNSPVRAFNGVGGTPVFMVSGNGPHLFDADGNRYVDYVCSWGPLICGHRHPDVMAAVSAQLECGLGFGTPSEIETTLAQKVCELVPSAEQVRMVNSGTEATMTAIRLARGITERQHIVKFEGCYHGHTDALLVKAGSGALTLGIPTSPGVPRALAELTLTLPYNDLAAAEKLFERLGPNIAAVILEPIAGNMNCVPPLPEFLSGLRKLTQQAGALLIFDEVMTGFRVARGGAQELYDIVPDLTVLGKIIGGGLPVGAVAGPSALLERLAPSGDVYQAGTLAGNPVAMASGLATLELVATEGFHDALAVTTAALVTGFQDAAHDAGVPLTVNHVPGMFGLFFTAAPSVTCFAEATACDIARFQRFYHGMLRRGVYLAPSAFEAGFVSSAHDATALSHTIDAARQAFQDLEASYAEP